jgi:hypothetical protein
VEEGTSRSTSVGLSLCLSLPHLTSSLSLSSWGGLLGMTE